MPLLLEASGNREHAKPPLLRKFVKVFRTYFWKHAQSVPNQFEACTFIESWLSSCIRSVAEFLQAPILGFLGLKNADLQCGSIESWGAPTDLQRARQQIIGFGRLQPWQAPKAHRPHKPQNISQNISSRRHFMHVHHFFSYYKECIEHINVLNAILLLGFGSMCLVYSCCIRLRE